MCANARLNDRDQNGVTDEIINELYGKLNGKDRSRDIT
jgi:hypothetical protein